MALAARGAVTLHTQKYALDDFQTAISDLDAGRLRGRAIVTPWKERDPMTAVKALLGIGISVGVLAGIWTYASVELTLITWVAFVAWACFFAAAAAPPGSPRVWPPTWPASSGAG